MKKKFTTVVFDFDGTIADTNQLIVGSWQAVYRARTGAEGDISYILSTFGEPLYYTMERTFPDFDVEESVEIYRNYQKKIFMDEIEIFPGMKELIIDLKKRGYKVGIATSRLRNSTIMGLEKFGLEDMIDALVTVEDTDKHKPDPEPALICLKKLGSTPEESIMVGDSAFDMGCGKNAGMTTVMVGWSEVAKSGVESTAKDAGACGDSSGGQLKLGSDDKADVFTPDYIIEEADDLWKILL
ncbi:MAG: HAD-IIIA family hydrolase [Firmicutes bacterium]|nr:HAD-IIIA family hydrolase [Bacillota bacterium]